MGGRLSLCPWQYFPTLKFADSPTEHLPFLGLGRLGTQPPKYHAGRHLHHIDRTQEEGDGHEKALSGAANEGNISISKVEDDEV